MNGNSSEFDAPLELCRAPHRRIALAVLAEHRRSLTLADLTKTIAKHDHGAPISDVSEAAVERIRLQLHHVHLPKLEAAGVVEYDRERNVAAPTERLDEWERQLSALLDAAPGVEPPIEL